MIVIILNNPNRTKYIPIGLVKYSIIIKFHSVINDIGKRIKAIRESKKLNAKNVADKVGILDTSLSKIERVGTNSVERLLKIAEALGVHPSEFFEDKPKAMAKEPKPDYGYATKDELSEIAHALLKLTKAVESMEERLPKKTLRQAQGPAPKKKYGKDKK